MSFEWLLNDGLTLEWQNDFRMMGRVDIFWIKSNPLQNYFSSFLDHSVILCHFEMKWNDNIVILWHYCHSKVVSGMKLHQNDHCVILEWYEMTGLRQDWGKVLTKANAWNYSTIVRHEDILDLSFNCHSIIPMSFPV